MSSHAEHIEQWIRRRAAIEALRAGAGHLQAPPDRIAVIESHPIVTGLLLPELPTEQQWGSSLRAVLSRKQWDRLRLAVCEEAGIRCIVCSAPPLDPISGRRHRPECHEQWSFEIHGDRFVQRLASLVPMCPDCHRCHHVGLAEHRGELHLVRSQLARVNGWGPLVVQSALDHAFGSDQHRLGFAWDLDLTALENDIELTGYPGLVIPAEAREQMGDSSFRN